MTEPLFLAGLDSPEVGRVVELTGDEGRHAAAVRRLRVGEIVLVSDGNGTAVRGPVASADKNGPSITVAEVLHEPRLWPEYHDDYYGAFVRDPDGNNVEAVCHLPE